MASSSTETDVAVLRRVEHVFGRIVASLCAEEPLVLTLKSKKPRSAAAATSDAGNPSEFQIRFPGRSPEEAWRFAVVLRVLGCIHEALVSNRTVSKRNIYYQNPTLFKAQAVVDRYVDILAYTYNVPRKGLNVSAAAKGLAAGHIAVHMADGSSAQRGVNGKQFIIDDPSHVSAATAPDARWILVVEKESSFRTLLAAHLHETSNAGKGVIVTAKGYPDVSTRTLLHLLTSSDQPKKSSSSPPPALALTDFDPDGIAIMSTYKYGSIALSHETPGLDAPGLQWLGIRYGDIISSREQKTEAQGSSLDSELHETGQHDQQASLLTLSARDRTKAVNMLTNSPILDEKGSEREWRLQLQVMLMLNFKAEMECLESRNNGDGIVGWVEKRLVEMTRMDRMDVCS